MSILTKLKVLGSDIAGTVINVQDDTGAYHPAYNPGGYGAPNTTYSDIYKIIFTVSRHKHGDAYRQTYVRPDDQQDIHELINPTIEEILQGATVELTSIGLQISSPEEGLVQFGDGVYDINQYSILDASVDVTGKQYSNFVQAESGLNEIYNNYDSVLLHDRIYQIDKSKFTSGGTFLYFTEELESDITLMNPAIRSNAKALMESQAEYYLRNEFHKLYASEEDCVCYRKKIDKIMEMIVHKVASREEFYGEYYEHADRAIQVIRNIGNHAKPCNCQHNEHHPY